VHRLVQAVSRQQLDREQERQWATIALHLIDAALPVDHSNPNVWPSDARLLPHVLAVTGHTDELGIDREETAELLNGAGLYLWQRADHEQARPLYERALAIREARLGPDHPDTVRSRQNLMAVVTELEDHS
jgi:hypothetical protein